MIEKSVAGSYDGAGITTDARISFGGGPITVAPIDAPSHSLIVGIISRSQSLVAVLPQIRRSFEPS